MDGAKWMVRRCIFSAAAGCKYHRGRAANRTRCLSGLCEHHRHCRLAALQCGGASARIPLRRHLVPPICQLVDAICGVSHGVNIDFETVDAKQHSLRAFCMLFLLSALADSLLLCRRRGTAADHPSRLAGAALDLPLHCPRPASSKAINSPNRMCLPLKNCSCCATGSTRANK